MACHWPAAPVALAAMARTVTRRPAMSESANAPRNSPSARSNCARSPSLARSLCARAIQSFCSRFSCKKKTTAAGGVSRFFGGRSTFFPLFGRSFRDLPGLLTSLIENEREGEREGERESTKRVLASHAPEPVSLIFPTAFPPHPCAHTPRPSAGGKRERERVKSAHSRRWWKRKRVRLSEHAFFHHSKPSSDHSLVK